MHSFLIVTGGKTVEPCLLLNLGEHEGIIPRTVLAVKTLHEENSCHLMLDTLVTNLYNPDMTNETTNISIIELRKLVGLVDCVGSDLVSLSHNMGTDEFKKEAQPLINVLALVHITLCDFAKMDPDYSFHDAVELANSGMTAAERMVQEIEAN
jgi:hypothetical protein